MAHLTKTISNPLAHHTFFSAHKLIQTQAARHQALKLKLLYLFLRLRMAFKGWTMVKWGLGSAIVGGIAFGIHKVMSRRIDLEIITIHL
jgi:hypothetical protein